MPVPEHRVLMRRAIDREAAAQRAALAGETDASRAAFNQAADDYRRSWELAPSGSYGRLVGMLKAAILAGEPAQAARYVQRALADDPLATPTAAYAVALAALVLGDDADALRQSTTMRAGSDAFGRAASAIEALARNDAAGYRQVVTEIVEDFERREGHLTGVRIADTAGMFERLAAGRGLSAGLDSPLVPPTGC